MSAAEVGTVRYGQNTVLTLTGTDLDQPLTVTSAGCRNLARSTTAPYISSATKAYYTCSVASVGSHTFSVARAGDGVALGSAPFTVPTPQVTMAVSNGAGVSGNLVITLTPQQAPVTVDNFLAYVNSGFYNGTVFHRHSPGFVLQAGGYAQGLDPTKAVPPLKATNPPITLEDNVGLSNVRLSLSMARTSAPDSATSQFFVNLADNFGLNYAPATAATAAVRGYAVFGNITAGADVVAAMAGAGCTAYPLMFGANLGGGTCTFVPNMVITSALQTR